jgi:hypothetical protein
MRLPNSSVWPICGPDQSRCKSVRRISWRSSRTIGGCSSTKIIRASRPFGTPISETDCLVLQRPVKSCWPRVERRCNFSVLNQPEDKIFDMEQWCLQIADDCLALHGLIVDDQSRRVLARAVGAAIQRPSDAGENGKRGICSQLTFLAERHGSNVVRFSLSAARRHVSRPVRRLSAERRPVAKTVYEWSRVVENSKSISARPTLTADSG